MGLRPRHFRSVHLAGTDWMVEQRWEHRAPPRSPPAAQTIYQHTVGASRNLCPTLPEPLSEAVGGSTHGW